ncbi:hypothetical protein DEU56DRAFT_757030 [Suillus clintonianus]|uniref:uncharacterized protein n=1 Tax=Suillus clintonianus TaxID=1904413 RepID=UPI001B865C0F|nr:uncharacterized protein DEU56DRAFT_757030 [Suillus clintonianus]KAG2134134.1 hypothetical protein DEU56DRAFT_757030 [Suillus clintonianus]
MCHLCYPRDCGSYFEHADVDLAAALPTPYMQEHSDLSTVQFHHPALRSLFTPMYLRLEREVFNCTQAEGIMCAMADVIDETKMFAKAEQEKDKAYAVVLMPPVMHLNTSCLVDAKSKALRTRGSSSEWHPRHVDTSLRHTLSVASREDEPLTTERHRALTFTRHWVLTLVIVILLMPTVHREVSLVKPDIRGVPEPCLWPQHTVHNYISALVTSEFDDSPRGCAPGLLQERTVGDSMYESKLRVCLERACRSVEEGNDCETVDGKDDDAKLTTKTTAPGMVNQPSVASLVYSFDRYAARYEAMVSVTTARYGQ